MQFNNVSGFYFEKWQTSTVVETWSFMTHIRLVSRWSHSSPYSDTVTHEHVQITGVMILIRESRMTRIYTCIIVAFSTTNTHEHTRARTRVFAVRNWRLVASATSMLIFSKRNAAVAQKRVTFIKFWLN